MSQPFWAQKRQYLKKMNKKMPCSQDSIQNSLLLKHKTATHLAHKNLILEFYFE